MIIIINSECSGNARINSQRILDDFLPRIGRRCWSGRITEQGLRRLKETLAKKVTTNSSICCQKVSGTNNLTVLWFLGNRRKFDSKGNCSVSESSKNVSTERIVSSVETLTRASSELAALFHDLGKATQWFQNKLAKAQAIADPIRHELVSYMILRAMLKLAYGDEKKWLARLADRDSVGEYIRESYKYAFLHAHEMTVHNLANNQLPSLAAAIEQSHKNSGKHVGIDFYPDANLPKFSLVSLMVLTHHRLPEGYIDTKSKQVRMSFQNMKKFWDDSGSSQKGGKFNKAVDEMLSLPNKKSGIWDDKEYLDAVSYVAQRLIDAVCSDNFHLDVRMASIYGRTSLILGDHKGSQVGNTKFPKEGERPDPKLVYANTNRNKGNVLAEPLSSHLRRVQKETSNALDNIFITKNEFPVIEHSEIPDAIRSPRIALNTPYNWQHEAAKETKAAFKATPEGSGFFGILMAGTGSGKTRMAPILLSALSRDGLRMNVCTGMRSLTLQGGREYHDDMHFKKEDISVVIGDELTSELFNLERSRSIGTDAEEQDQAIVVTPDGASSDHILPKSTARLLRVDATSSNSTLLASPILVSTIDTLMSAADANRGRHVIKSLRLASADLVIDEIDDYCNEDLVAISRLIYLAAAFGRKIIISSATVSPDISKSLWIAYKEGWSVHCHAIGNQLPVLTGWYSEVCAPLCDVIPDTDTFTRSHGAFVGSILTGLDQKLVLRKTKIAEVGNPKDITEFFDLITNEIVNMHRHHHVVDEKSGKNLSLGVVRWNNVAPSFLHSRFLLDRACPNDHDIFVVPYNGTLLPAVRFHVETSLNKMLKRKSRNGHDPVLSNDLVRNVLDNRTSAKNVIILVVTTSIEEVGRDHDFDFAIVEPGSLRGLIQMGGRVRRHRQIETDYPNIAIMERSFKELRSMWGEEFKTRNGYFSYPGIETPIKLLDTTAKPKDFAEKTKLSSHLATDLYDISALSERLDARDAIAIAPSEMSILGAKERELTRSYLEDGLAPDEQLSVNDYVRDDMALLSNHHPKNRKFRRTDAYDIPYTLKNDGKWYVLDPKLNTEPSNTINSMICPLEIANENRLLLQLGLISELTEQLCANLWSDDEEVPSWKRNSLSTISRPIRVSRNEIKEISSKINTTRFYFNASLGMVEQHKWLKQFI